MAMEGLRISLTAERPLAREHGIALIGVVGVLEELAEHHDLNSVPWEVVNATGGSVHTTIHAENAQSVESVFLEGVKAFACHRQPSGWTQTAYQRFGALKMPTQGELTVRSAKGRRELVITRSLCAFARKLSDKSEPTFFGSVTGTLDKPQQIGGHKAIIMDRLLHRAVVISYPEDRTNDVREAWGKTVEVWGPMIKNAKGHPRFIRADDMRVVPTGTSNFSSIIGLLKDDPDFDPTEYLEAVRG